MGKFESKFDIYLNTEDPAIVRNMIDKYVLGLNRKIHILVETTDESVIRDLLSKSFGKQLGRENYLFRHRPMIMTALCGMRKQF